MQGPLVSVVIPTFNRKDMLADAVESCLGQTWQELEAIVVDDGSTDGTDDEVARLLKTTWSGGRVRYVRREGSGASCARNHGIGLARGEYIQFLDSDDLLMPTKIARQIALLEDPLFGDAPCCHCYGTIGLTAGVSERKRVIGSRTTDASALLRSMCSRRVHVLQTAAPLWRGDHLKQHSGWREDIGLGDDLEYYARLLVGVREVGFVDEELFVVREHSGGRLSVGGSTVSSVSSLLKTRRSVHKSVKRAGLWDEGTQQAFLGAMRTIYANALETGNAEIIGDLERWMLELASAPRRRPGIQAMIGARRLLGRRFLLGAHRLVKGLRAD